MTSEQKKELEGKSLWLFSNDNRLRLFLSKVVNHPVFESIIIFLIVVSTLTLALEGPLDNPESQKMKILTKIDYFMTSVFTLEVVLKVIVYGFIKNKKKSYLRSGWNILDFTIVFFALFSIFFDAKI